MAVPATAQFSSLAGRTAIITGSSRGLGAAMALGLASRGARVLITYTSTSSTAKAEELVHQINLLGEKTGVRAAAVRADLRQVETMERIVTAALSLDAADREGAWVMGVDILVNNAAGSLNKGLDQVTAEDYASIYDLNVRAPLLLTQALLPHLRRPGRIINIGSVAGRCGMKMLGLYCSSKAALEGLTRCWAAELGTDGTTVNCVAPGPVESELLASIPKEIVEMQKASTPVGQRVGTPEEVADVVAWLASEESRWLSGQVLNVSGGWTMY